MNAIRELMVKEFLQIRQDRRMLPLILLAPIIQVILLGYAATVDVNNIPMVVYDADRSVESRAYLERFTNSGYFTIVGFVDRPSEMDKYLDETRAILAMNIPARFGRNVGSGRSVAVQLLADGADANTASISLNYAAQITAGYAQSLIADQLVRIQGVSIPRVTSVSRVWFNPDLRSANYMIPGVVALILMIITTTFSSAAIVREKEAGTIEQILVTPIKPHQFILGKLLPFILIGFLDVVLVLGVAIIWFDIPLKGSVPLLFGLCGLFILTTLGLGLFVSTISRTQQQAMMTAQFFIFFPFLFLSGFTFPIENMPPIIQALTYGIPLRYFITIVRGLFLKGVGLETLWPQALALLGFGVIILSLAVARFQKRLG
ncbi:MAG: ABC transporter permease [Ignavibacteriales bacterium]|nr:ABC transporter permease [Ignavibacteriales bacterium]